MGKWNTISKGNVTVEDDEESVLIRVEKDGLLSVGVWGYSDFKDLCDIIDVINNKE